MNFNAVRALARSHKWQVVYSRSKEMAKVNLFNNDIEFTPIQVAFLQWLEIYHGLELDLAMKEEHLSREVIENDIRCDAYLVIRNDKRNKKEKDAPAVTRDEFSDIPSVVFK
jgi:hypothetical protein